MSLGASGGVRPKGLSIFSIGWVNSARRASTTKGIHAAQVLACPCGLDEKHRERSLRLLSKICKAHAIIPNSYIIQQDLIRVGKVRYHGGFADVSDGEYLGQPVAVKRLKMNEGDSDKIFKVPLIDPGIFVVQHSAFT